MATMVLYKSPTLGTSTSNLVCLPTALTHPPPHALLWANMLWDNLPWIPSARLPLLGVLWVVSWSDISSQSARRDLC